MSSLRPLLALVVAGLVLFAPPAHAVDAPRQMTFQGRLVRADGSPETLPQDLRFALYATPAGGAPLWEESHLGTPVTNGYYAVVLGASQPLPANVLNGQALYLGVSLVGQSELTPRLPVVSVPYALLSNDSNRLEGRAAASFADSTHTHASVPLAENSNRLEGRAASTFANATHTHASVPLAEDSNLLEGRAAASFANATHTHSLATTSASGFMAATDKSKLNGLPSNFEEGLTRIASTLSVSFGGSGTAPSAARSDHSHPLPTLGCVYRTAQGNIDTGRNSTAWCATNEVLTGGGCADLNGTTTVPGITFGPTGVTTQSGSSPTGGAGYTCSLPGATSSTSVPTAYAICCRMQ